MNDRSVRLEIDRMSKSYGDKPAVQNLSLTINAGEIFCFLGRNGAGKTTTIHTIVGQKNPTEGDVRIRGVSVSSPGIHAEWKRVGYLPEEPTLHDHLTGREFLLFLAELYGVDESRLEWIEQSLALLELGADADAMIRTYSLGMKKKIAVLASLVHDPDIIVFDEPTGAMDAAGARVVKDIMVQARDDGKLVFFTTHIMEIAEKLADRIAIIDNGRLIADGSLEKLRDQFGKKRVEPLEDLFLRITEKTGVQAASTPMGS
ncbi:ABC transporter ATP-binding protein [Gemmatimonadota bacterium]